jgi:hypothetical protein
MKAHHSLIKTALLKGLVIRVNDGEEEFQCRTFDEAVKVIEDVEEAWLCFNDGWQAYVLPYGVGDDETIADWTTTRDDTGNWIDRWFDAYNADNNYPGTPPAEININQMVPGGDI